MISLDFIVTEYIVFYDGLLFVLIEFVYMDNVNSFAQFLIYN